MFFLVKNRENEQYRFTKNFDFLDQIWAKTIFLVENNQNEHHHGILHIRINLGTKFKLKIDNFAFSDQICAEGVISILM